MNDEDYTYVQSPEGGYGDSQQPGTLYAAKGAKGGKAGATPSKPKLKTPKNGEVIILARFMWEPPISGATESKLLLEGNGQWHPGFLDYVEITEVTTKKSPGNLIDLMNMITEYTPNSIERLNFFTHANRDWVGIEGYMEPSDVIFRSSVTETEIAGHASAGFTFTVNKHTFTLNDVRSRFAEDAIFVLYGCDVAFDPTTLLTAWKDLFQVTTIGFKTKTLFCPPTPTADAKEFNRKGETIGVKKPGFKCGVDSTRDWRALINDPNAVKVAK